MNSYNVSEIWEQLLQRLKNSVSETVYNTIISPAVPLSATDTVFIIGVNNNFLKKWLEENEDKPFVLCEYMHDMGNSLGGMKSYMDLLEKYDRFQGGFIWDFIDQALWVEDEVTGRRVLRYGGDFDDRPSDYAFSGDGIVFADRTVKPAIQEVKYYYGTYK